MQLRAGLGMWAAVAALGCGDGEAVRGEAGGRGGSAGQSPQPPGAGGLGGQGPRDPGVRVPPREPGPVGDERSAVNAALDAVKNLTADGLLEKYRAPFQPAPSYDLATVGGLSLIQGSNLALNEAELATLSGHGFVVTDRRRAPSFLYAYATIYLEDLPVYVSADSILFALHRSYDRILASVERGILVADLNTLLEGMRARLGAGAADPFPANVRADADLYLALAAGLLAGREVAPVAGADPVRIHELFEMAMAASGYASVELFGTPRDEDFSQFKPRGHYTASPELERYFRAMMWLGRTDFRMLETQRDGSQLFRRRQLEGALALHALIDAPLRPHFDRIDRTVSAFVGEHDYMQLDELDALLADLGVASAAGLAALSDEAIARAIADGGYGTQRISSHIMINGLGAGTLPLSSSFALLGQRYVIDSHVFSNVVYDRVAGGGVYRMMPDPLDVGFAALKNDQAAGLLESQLREYAYAPDLASMRVLADAHPPEYWWANLYNHWLGAVRELSPRAEAIASPSSGLPPVARSEAWGKRLLSAQLASWAELRHDTLLYAKQSYTSGAVCEYPDAYVDPYPEFYARVAAYAAFGKELVAELAAAPHAPPELGARITGHFELLGDVASRLQRMAEHELTGAAFTPEMMSFINEAVVTYPNCDGTTLLSQPGWYGKLFFEPHTSVELDPTVADVHTQPTDAGGGIVGRVLHAGTGYARQMVVITEGCSGPRAYVGPVSSYFERVTEQFERLTDEEWKVQMPAAADPPWLADIVAR